MRRLPIALVLLLPFAALLSLAPACDEAVPQPCTGIPEGGCPLSRGVACEDLACEAVYACRPGNVWELQEHCPPRDGGRAPFDSAAPDPPPPARPDAAVDAPPGAHGGPGCVSLQVPDCALGVALACGPDCCGCEDLYVCEDGGWSLWGVCTEAGIDPPP